MLDTLSLPVHINGSIVIKWDRLGRGNMVLIGTGLVGMFFNKKRDDYE